MIILSVWGSTGTLSYEEIIAFTPIFVALSIALGYDALVGVAISVIPVGVGFASATVNPFTIGVAQTIAELPLFSGLGYRCVILAVMTAYTILYVLWYARRIKKDPSKSLVSNVDYSDFTFDEERLSTPFTLERKLSMLVLCIGVAAMGYGLIFLKWYINQVAAIFIIVSIVVGIINHWSANKIADTLCEGLSRGVLAAIGKSGEHRPGRRKRAGWQVYKTGADQSGDAPCDGRSGVHYHTGDLRGSGRRGDQRAG